MTVNFREVVAVFLRPQLKKEIMSRRRSPHTLLELSSAFIAKCCARRVVGVQRVASALASQLLPRVLLQRICAKVNLASEERQFLLDTTSAGDHPIGFLMEPTCITFIFLKWFPAEETAYRTAVCNREMDRHLIMLRQQQQQPAESSK